ncbi:S41 family peptidase [Paenibacillus piri]|uniref:S41 family peptidase n=1 Tax=Paenibacillus piri TaxID=2547395 RepID=A0A4R5KX33_9BACL|nr:S41 family peptidase [Paenibacillus piri]TDF99550.1 S41 family peptidase [Paenibacillus piri]
MSTKSKRTVWKRTAAAVLSLTLLFPAASSALAADKASGDSARLKEVFDLIQQNHVSKPDAKKLSETAIRSMVTSLNDPYTVYFTAEELKKFEGSLQNNYVGVGVRVVQQDDGVYVFDVMDGPAKKAGMKEDDLISAVDGESVEGLKIDDITKKIMGVEGTKVSVTVKRGGESIVFNLTRQTIQLPVVVNKRFDPGVGYLRVTSFSSDAAEAAAEQLGQLKQQGINSLILDLRDNPGGLVDTAVNMAKLFVKEGVLIHTKDRDDVDEPVKFSNGTTQPFPVYILVNEYSASASEVLTGALQDYNVATKVIGMKTYGKGSVQTLFPLSGGDAIKITIEEYLTPKMRKVNKVGITPDIEVDGEVPQLITALREAGIGKISVGRSKKGVTINGIAVDDDMGVIRENGAVFVPSRLLSTLLGGTIVWNGDDQSVQLAAGGATGTYAAAAGELKLDHGISYIQIGRVAETFRQLEWSDNEAQFTVTASK